jgi:hypothetical protein
VGVWGRSPRALARAGGRDASLAEVLRRRTRHRGENNPHTPIHDPPAQDVPRRLGNHPRLRKDHKLEPSDLIGSTGVGLILIAFILNLADVLDRTTRSYLILNLVGASLTLLASALIAFYPFVVLEAAWALAALIGLLRRPVSGTARS